MQKFVILDQNNNVVRAGTAKTLRSDAIPVRTPLRPADLLKCTMVFQPRKVLDLPDSVTGNVLDISTVPEGSRIEASDHAAGEVLFTRVVPGDEEPDWSSELRFGDPGVYEVEITPPPDFLPATVLVTVP